MIRNEALLLLLELARGNANIQKIIVFENAFDRLFSIVADEGYSDGDIIVEDCLRLVYVLVHGNDSNQVFFRETRCAFLCWLSNFVLSRCASCIHLFLTEICSPTPMAAVSLSWRPSLRGWPRRARRGTPKN
jgi:hypothetical protein